MQDLARLLGEYLSRGVLRLGQPVLPMLLVTFSDAQTVHPVYELIEEETSLINLQDAVVTEWQELFARPSLTASDFGVVESADFDIRVWLAWHDASNRLYVAVERVDDVYVHDFVRGRYSESGMNGDQITHDGSLHLSVFAGRLPAPSNPKCRPLSRLCYQDEVRYVQTYSILPVTFDDLPPTRMQNYFDEWFWFLQPPWMDVGGGSFGERPTVMTLEMYLTLYDDFRESAAEAVPADLSAGDIISFYMFVPDYDRVKAGSIWPDSSYETTWREGLLLSRGSLQDTGPPKHLESAGWARTKLKVSAEPATSATMP